MKMKALIALAVMVAAPACAQERNAILEIDKTVLSAKLSSGEYGAVSSLWIEQSGEVIYYEHFRDTDKTTYHNMRSVGKTVTGMLIGAVIDDGLIKSVDERAASFFGNLQPFENPDPRKEAITLEHLLTMSGPLECDDFNSYSRGNEERMYLVEDWSGFFWNLPIKNRPSWEIPENGSSYERLFSYCTAGSQLIGEIVEQVSRKSAPDYAQTRLFSPIGITEPKWNFAQTGQAHLGGGLELTTQDWGKLGRLMLNQGRAGDQQVLSKEWVAASFTNYVQASEATGYGYFFWRPEYSVGGKLYEANMMSGTGANRIYILPEFDLVMVITKNNFRDRDAHNLSDTLFEKEIVEKLNVKLEITP